ncbi:MAG: PrgI family protein [Patescibacteria group bacterium]
MQFKVPQFLDIEDKIFGPLTFKQFVYLIGGAGLCFILYKLLGLLLAFIPIIIIAGIVVALAFYRPNNKPLVEMLESGFKFYIQSKLYIWQRRKQQKKEGINQNKKETQPEQTSYKQRGFTGSKLKDLAWSLDVLDLKKNNSNNNNEEPARNAFSTADAGGELK